MDDTKKYGILAVFGKIDAVEYHLYLLDEKDTPVKKLNAYNTFEEAISQLRKLKTKDKLKMTNDEIARNLKQLIWTHDDGAFFTIGWLKEHIVEE